MAPAKFEPGDAVVYSAEGRRMKFWQYHHWTGTVLGKDPFGRVLVRWKRRRGRALVWSEFPSWLKKLI